MQEKKLFKFKIEIINNLLHLEMIPVDVPSFNNIKIKKVKFLVSNNCHLSTTITRNLAKGVLFNNIHFKFDLTNRTNNFFSKIVSFKPDIYENSIFCNISKLNKISRFVKIYDFKNSIIKNLEALGGTLVVTKILKIRNKRKIHASIYDFFDTLVIKLDRLPKKVIMDDVINEDFFIVSKGIYSIRTDEYFSISRNSPFNTAYHFPFNNVRRDGNIQLKLKKENIILTLPSKKCKKTIIVNKKDITLKDTFNLFKIFNEEWEGWDDGDEIK